MTSRADALRVVEAIELLLDAGQWQPADDLYRNRSGRPEVWQTLPAARLGQRAATAFVATPARRDACATHLSPRAMGYYLNSAGLWATACGRPGHGTGISTHGRPRQAVKWETWGGLAIRLQNLTECLGQLGQTRPGPGRRGRGTRQRAG